MPIADKLNKASNGTAPVATTLSALKASGATTCSLQIATGWPTTTACHFVLYQVDANSAMVAGTKTLWKGTLSGTTISNMELKSGTEPAAGYPIGSVAEPMLTSAQWDELVDALLVSLDQDGNILADNTATFASNIDVNDSSTAIRDTSDNELLKFSKTTSAVNELTVKNAATGNAPEIQATGGDTNVGLKLVPQGTGILQPKYNCMARAYASTNQSITSGAARKVQLDTENYDVGANFDSTTNYRFTAPITGYYQVNANVTFSNIAAGEQIIIYVFVNGLSVAESKAYVPNVNDDPAVAISDLLYLSSTDYVELYVQCTSTKTLTSGSSRCFMSVNLVSV